MGKALEKAALIIPRGYLHGLTLSTAGSSTTFTVALGEACDDGFSSLMTLGSSLAKTTGSWAVGAATGSLDTGTIAASTWYHVYLIKRPDTGIVDVLTSLSATSPTMPTNYTLKRRIGSLLTNGSSQWVLFNQLGDEFLWNTVFTDVNGIVPGVTTAVLRTLTVPTGVQVTARVKANSKDNTSAGAQLLLSSPDESDQTVDFDQIGISPAGNNTAGSKDVRTNTSGQIRTRVNTTTVAFTVWTYGWIDTRGKLF